MVCTTTSSTSSPSLNGLHTVLRLLGFLGHLFHGGSQAFTAVPRQRIKATNLHTTYSKKGHIEVSSHVVLPFSADVAFDRFSKLTDQPTYSPWLKEVTYTNGYSENELGATSKWKVKFLGLGFSWRSISTGHDRENSLLEWESTTGLQNSGRCEFRSLSETESEMRLSMNFKFGSTVLFLLGENRNKIKHLIENRMLSTTTQNFSQMVYREIAQSSMEEESPNLERQLQLVSSSHSQTVTQTILPRHRGFQPVVPQDDFL